MKIKFIASVLILQIFLCQLILAQTERGAGNIKTERKIALIIGNTNYDTSIGRLTNPVNDARDMADALRRLGFTLVGGKPQLDVNRRQMLELVREFGREIKQGGIGFFYFSGHGVQVNKENYILPITDSLQYEDDAETEAVRVDMVAKEMDLAGNRLNILVLDACRNNGLQKRSRNTDKGLTEPARKPEGTFIAFSAGDGQTASDGTGRNGLFTQELLRNLETPNVRLDDIFRTTRNEVKRLSDGKQVPILYDSTSQAFILKYTGNEISQIVQTPQINLSPDSSVVSNTPIIVSRISLKEIEQSFNANLYDETIKLGKEFLSFNPDDKDANTYVGISFLRNKDTENAVIYLQKSISLGNSIPFQLKRSKLELIGAGGDTDNIELLISKEVLYIKDDSKLFQIKIKNLSDAILRNWENRCPYFYLKGVFLESRTNSNNKTKEEVKEFYIFPGSVSKKEFPNIFSNKYKTLGNECIDEGVLTITALKLINFFRIER